MGAEVEKHAPANWLGGSAYEEKHYIDGFISMWHTQENEPQERVNIVCPDANYIKRLTGRSQFDVHRYSAEIYMAKDSEVRDFICQHIGSVPKLKSLSLKSNGGLSSDTLNALLKKAEKIPDLEELTFDFSTEELVPHTPDYNHFSLLSTFKNLIKLTVTSSNLFVSPKGMLLENLPNLKSLILKQCTFAISKEVLQDIIEHGKNLEQLVLDDPDGETNKSNEKCQELLNTLKITKGLELRGPGSYGFGPRP